MVKKIEKITIDLNKIDRDLKHKSQELNPIFVDEYFNKKQIILQETDWITVTPNAYEFSMTQNQPLPAYIDFSQFLDIIIPQNFLPFIDVQLISKTPDNLKFTGIMPYNHLEFIGDVVEVYGNGSTLIYKGGLPQMGQIFQLIGLEFGINPAHTVKIWVGEVYYNDGPIEYKVFGHVPFPTTPVYTTGYKIFDKPGSLATRYQKIAGNWVFLDYYAPEIFPTTDVQSESWVFNGYWVLYEPYSARADLSTVVVANESPLVVDGIFYKIILGNLPTYPTDAETDPRYWSTIVLKRNQDSFVPYSEARVQIGKRQQSIVKGFPSTDTKKENYRLRVSGTMVFESLATISSPIQIPVYDDIYTKVTFEEGNPKDYTRTTVNHSLRSIGRFYVDAIDIDYKIRIVLSNPHDYQNRSEFKT